MKIFSHSGTRFGSNSSKLQAYIYFEITFTLCYVCIATGHLRIARSAQSSVRVRFGDDLRLDWDGRGRVLLKVGL